MLVGYQRVSIIYLCIYVSYINIYAYGMYIYHILYIYSGAPRYNDGHSMVYNVFSFHTSSDNIGNYINEHN